MKILNIIILVVFGFAIIIAVLVFSLSRSGSEQALGQVNVWGTFPASQMNIFVDQFNTAHNKQVSLSYREISEDTFETTLINALAAGRGPDLIFIPDDLLVKHSDKLFPVPFENFSARDFRDRFVEGGEIFLGSNGSLAFPLLVDPMVMYYNRDLLASENIALPPSNWAEVNQIVPSLSQVDSRNNILQSAIAFGEFENVNNAKDIFVMLLLQIGDPLVVRNQNTSSSYQVTFGDQFNFVVAPAVAALDFFNQFANPARESYSWSRSLPASREAFTGGLLATYFGFASEQSRLRAINPNLNFDVAVVPQRSSTNISKTFGHFYGGAVVRGASNPAGAFQALFLMTDPVSNKNLADAVSLAPALRQALATGHENPFFNIFYRSALISDTWLDPDAERTNAIFGEMINNVSVGRVNSVQAVRDAQIKLKQIFGF